VDDQMLEDGLKHEDDQIGDSLVLEGDERTEDGLEAENDLMIDEDDSCFQVGMRVLTATVGGTVEYLLL